MTRFADFSGSAALSPNFPAGLSVTRITLDNIRRNWLFFASLTKSLPPMGVIKADAYGHGLERVARVLLDAGCRALAVGSTNEGALLRQCLGAAGEDIPILPLLGVATPEDAAATAAHKLFPLIASAEQAALVSAAWSGPEPLPVVVKVETGLARLGFRSQDMASCVASLRSCANLRPTMVLSHLAAADDPAQDESVAMQIAQFLADYKTLREFWPDITLSLANSASFLAQDALLANLPPHVARPGYSLFGGNPLHGTRRESLGRALVPAMEAASPVTGVYDLKKGQTVGYGRTFTAEKNMRVAVIGAGYADGFSRGLSAKGHVCIRGVRCPVIGRICMQMHIVSVDAVPDTALGDAAFLLGGDGPGAIGMEDIALDWGTIPHEVFVCFGKNPRIYR